MHHQHECLPKIEITHIPYFTNKLEGSKHSLDHYERERRHIKAYHNYSGEHVYEYVQDSLILLPGNGHNWEMHLCSAHVHDPLWKGRGRGR